MVTKLLMNPFGISMMKNNLIYRMRWRFPKEYFGGQKWKIEVVASDGSLQSEPAVAEIEISNTLPTAFITETVVTTDMDANWKISVEDVDQQELNLEIEIKVNDTTVQTDSYNTSFPYEEFDISLSSDILKRG